MIGAIIGDIVGSRFEFNNHKNKDFELFTGDCRVTDDSIMTLAVAKAIMETEKITKLITKPSFANRYVRILIVISLKLAIRVVLTSHICICLRRGLTF